MRYEKIGRPVGSGGSDRRRNGAKGERRLKSRYGILETADILKYNQDSQYERRRYGLRMGHKWGG
jgi:hypothetical protein